MACALKTHKNIMLILIKFRRKIYMKKNQMNIIQTSINNKHTHVKHKYKHEKLYKMMNFLPSNTENI